MDFQVWITEHEPIVRLSVFISILFSMMLLEILIPKRALTQSKPYRWANNIALVVFNTLLMRLLLPFATVGVAVYAAEHQYGILHWINEPAWIGIIVSVFLLDFIIYWQHRIFHNVPILWKLHRVHHIDQDIDVTTGSRFHPIEICLSLIVKFSAVLLLGVPVVAVILFEVLLNACAMFNHSNIALPKSLDKLVRVFLVTPDMHRVHHSNIKSETHSNFGFNTPLWDRMFASYQSQPKLGHKNMVIGVDTYTDKVSTQNVFSLLKHPFNRNE